jgi:hypothetical protein
MADKTKVLVVANQTAESDELIEALRKRASEGEVEFTVLIPATPHGVSWAGDMFAGGDEAKQHLDAMLERLRENGLPVENAEIGDPDPLAATQDAANLGSYDEVIVSTLPLHVSKWLKVDLPHKVAHATGLPVTHVEASKAG